MGKPASEVGGAPPELIELIQFYALRQDPVTLTIESSSLQRGWISIDRGDVVRATTAGAKQGVDAFVEIVSWNQPSIVQLERAIHDAPNVDVPLAQLLLESYWRALEHEPTDPEQIPNTLTVGLDEDTVAAETHFGPPDGVTKKVVKTAQRMSELPGFLAVALISCRDGECVEILGDRSTLTVPGWMAHVVEVHGDPEFERALFVSERFVDIVVPPVDGGDIAFLLRLRRGAATDRDGLTVDLRAVLEDPGDETDPGQ